MEEYGARCGDSGAQFTCGAFDFQPRLKRVPESKRILAGKKAAGQVVAPAAAQAVEHHAPAHGGPADGPCCPAWIGAFGKRECNYLFALDRLRCSRAGAIRPGREVGKVGLQQRAQFGRAQRVRQCRARPSLERRTRSELDLEKPPIRICLVEVGRAELTIEPVVQRPGLLPEAVAKINCEILMECRIPAVIPPGQTGLPAKRTNDDASKPFRFKQKFL